MSDSRAPRARVAVFAAVFFVLAIPERGAGVAIAGQIEGELPEDILILGSSLVRGLKKPLKGFLKTDGSKVKIKTRGPAKWLLSKHAERKPTEKAIQSHDWDFVFVAEQSDGIWAERYPGARGLHGKVQAFSTAQMMFLMTWRDRGMPPASYDNLHGRPGENIGYVPIAFELDVPVAPAGWAFRRSIVDDRIPFDLWKDGHHLHKRGKYLVACVMYAIMTGQSPTGLPAPRSVPSFEAAYLQALARDTVFDPTEDWNLAANRALQQ